MHSYASEMAQNFWTAIYAWTSCFIVTIVVSMLTRPRADQELVGLVYSLTPRQSDAGRVWYQRPVTLGAIVLAASVVLNIVFW
jgi:solute:Na+ symporter, SSS family